MSKGKNAADKNVILMKPPERENKGISTEAEHHYRIHNGVKYRTTSSFLMDQKRKRLNKGRIVKKADPIPEYFKNFIMKGESAIEFRVRALQKHLDNLNVDFKEAAQIANKQRPKTGQQRKT